MYAFVKTLRRHLGRPSHPRAGRDRAAHFRPGLEALERRELPAAITSLYNTGVDNAGKVLADGAADPHYAITAAPAPDQPGAAQVVLQNNYPIGPFWAPDGTASKWVAPHANENDYPNAGGTTEPVGQYTYETTFSLQGLAPATAAISGQFSDDDRLVKVLINGADAGVPATTPGDFTGWHPFQITKGFGLGVNKLDFVVENVVQTQYANNQHNPSGFRVEMTGTADPASISVVRAFTLDSQSLKVDYYVKGDNGSIPIPLNVYRGVTNQAGAAGQVKIAQLTLKGANAIAGAHEITIAPGGFLQADALRPDPNHQFVVVTADQNGALNPADVNAPPSASFHIFLIGAVAQGFTTPDLVLDWQTGISFNAPPQTWVDTMTGLLTADKYNAVIPFHWENASYIPFPSVMLTEGQLLGSQVVIAAYSLHPGPDDVVDVHFIGHSRGSVVISQALMDLNGTNPATQYNISSVPSFLKSSFMIMTMLDPHPANNTYGNYDNYFSLNPLNAVRSAKALAYAGAVKAFQALAQDPNVVVPANVRVADDYYQNTPVGSFTAGVASEEDLINLWGELDTGNPATGIDNQSSVAITSHPLTNGNVNGNVIGHGEVTDYYISLLGTLQAPKLPPQIIPF